MNEAFLAQRCAPEEYAAAQKMQAKAKALSKEGKYDEAKAAAMAAEKLAVKARQKAAARRDDCLKPKGEGSEPIKIKEFLEKDEPPIEGEEGELQMVYFDYSVSELSPEARKTIKGNSAWMKRHPKSRIILGGHADKRGSTEYNLALAERRAFTAQKYLLSLGIEAVRLRIISYGEEMLLDYGDSEAAHTRNRRVEFRPY